MNSQTHRLVLAFNESITESPLFTSLGFPGKAICHSTHLPQGVPHLNHLPPVEFERPPTFGEPALVVFRLHIRLLYDA